ncbi:transcriptional regulator [Pseudomonas abieticivorans]|uniref:transcriptional regulator n=1 Tax=Pseudomonas abieticivorans TaxID=2931382 RepID=UPI0020BEFFF3|nr:transcriptional regulator [Pseudomonas sp. PIA16]
MNVPDEQLVAFLDGELDTQAQIEMEHALDQNADLARRLEYLERSSLPYPNAYGELLAQAPQERLAAMLAALPAPSAGATFGRRRLLAVAASCLLAGIAADRLFIGWHAHAGKADQWREVVADYMALYTAQTLENLPSDEAAQTAQLQVVEHRLGLALKPAQLKLPGIEFKRAQVLQYDDRPIAQITYLDPLYGPMALCLTLNEGGTQVPAHERRYGMNVVFWANGGHAFMLIGHNPAPDLASRMQALRVQLAG